MPTRVPASPPSTVAGVRASMQSNRRAGTKPERELRSQLHRVGLRFRKDHRLDLAAGRVRPDIVFTRIKVAVFVDGCFWHGCPDHGVQPRSNDWYWGPKLARNVERDRAADALLADEGWLVVRVWEHEPVVAAASRVKSAVAQRRRDFEGRGRND